MITKGYIEEIIDDNKIKVRCPTLDFVKGSNRYVENLGTSTICTLPSTNLNAHVGDVVFVGFEDNSRYKPVVLGYLYKSSFDPTYSSMKLDSMIVRRKANFSKDTSIGDVNSNCIANLSGASGNIQEQLDAINECINDSNDEVSEIKEAISDVERTMLSIDSANEKNLDVISNIKDRIGDKNSRDASTFYGELNIHMSNLNDLDACLGAVSKDNTVADMLQKLQSECDDIFNTLCDDSSCNSTETSSMLSRAEKMINVSWKPNKSFNKWNSSEKFIRGTSYTGMPYTMFSYGYTYDAWKKHAEDNTAVIGNISGYGERTGPKYGSCCADFVSEVIGLPSHQRSCYGLKNQTKYLTKLSEKDALASNIQVGDVLLASGESHVMWVGNVNGDTLTVYEQNPPLAHKFTLSKSKNSKDGFIFWGNVYNKILRPTQDLLSLESNTIVDVSKIVGNNWICKGNKSYGVYSEQSLTDSEYMNNALVFWKLCKKAGWTAEAAAGAWSNTYGESTGNPWAYGTGGGGLFGFTPFDKGTKYKTGIYDYARDVLKDTNRRWNGDDQVGFINWQIENIKKHGWTGIFSIRNPVSKYWNYTPPSDTSIPTNNFNLDTYIKLNKKNYGATPEICAKLWLARYGVVDKTYPGRDLNKTIDAHIKKANELYQLFSKN